MNIFQQIFNRLEALTDGIAEFASKPGNHKILKADGFMDLHVECIGKNHISLAHYYVQNGDLMADPEMEVRIVPETMMAEALTYSQASPPIYQQVYTADGKRYYPRLRSDLNSFLRTWLKNLENQGFYKRPKTYAGKAS